MKGHRSHGYTLAELAIILLLIVALVLILLPVVTSPRKRPRRQMPNNTQVRGIHQALVMYSQGNGAYYPGLDEKGGLIDATTEGRLQLLLEANYFTGEYMISPNETKTAWTTGKVTSANYSYAMPDIDAGPGGRLREWRDTLNTEAVGLSDRNTGTDADANVQSIHMADPGEWRGSVAWNDNHVVFETTHILETRNGLRYEATDVERANKPINPADNLFASDSPDDALMIHSGQ